MKRVVETMWKPARVICQRQFSTSQANLGLFKKIKKSIVKAEDLDKRPSELEIKEKNLPANTPTLRQRIDRDTVHQFHVRDKHAGYYLGPTGTWKDYVDEDMTLKDVVVDGYKQLKCEFKILRQEVKDWNKVDFFSLPGDRKQLWDFEANQTTDDDLNKDFIVTADSTWGEGYSWGKLEANPAQNSALFFGELNTNSPQDGRAKTAGYVNFKSVTKRKSFHRLKRLGFEHFNAVTLKVRGDGRAYSLNIHLHEFWDLTWMDLYQFPVYTRGGPYWQEVVIPYNRFVMCHRGAIQDRQDPFDETEVTNIGLTIMDQVNGPFNLEIAQIGLLFSPAPIENDDSRSAYESYRMPSSLYLGTHM